MPNQDQIVRSLLPLAVALACLNAFNSRAQTSQGPQTWREASAATVAPQRTLDVGKREFDSNCASCHGLSAKGNGPVAGFLKKNPPDLTLLSKNNQGIFPMNRLYEVIEGESVAAHGTREMPIWGREYRIRDGEYFGDMPYDANALVRSRILALLEYLHRLQQK